MKENLQANAPPIRHTSWKMRAITCIAQCRQYVTTLDILNCLLGRETFENLDEKQRREQVTQLSVTLSNMVNDRIIQKVKIPGIRGNYYGLNDWFEVNGDIKQEYADAALNYLIKTEKNKSLCCD